MSTETQKVDVLAVMNQSALLIGNLPELPGYNGSILMIDDGESSRIDRELTQACAVVADLIDAARAVVDHLHDYTDDECRLVDALSRIGGGEVRDQPDRIDEIARAALQAALGEGQGNALTTNRDEISNKSVDGEALGQGEGE